MLTPRYNDIYRLDLDLSLTLRYFIFIGKFLFIFA
jgi:hypothetical protein